MFDQEFYRIDLGEIFQQSHCMYHEHAMVHLFSSVLMNMGYQKIPGSARAWGRGSRKVIVCLADDFGVNRDDWSLPPDSGLILTPQSSPTTTCPLLPIIRF